MVDACSDAWYIQIMASLQRVKVKGHSYWRIVESRRVNGKPRAIPILHLGNADDLLRRLQGAGMSGVLRLKSFEHGSIAALASVAKRLDVVATIDRHIPGRRGGISVGTSLLLAALNRAVAPRSKNAWAEWARETSIARLFAVKTDSMTSQHFWDQMDRVPLEAIQKIEDDLTRRVVSELGIRLDALFYDVTNFFTFIDSANGRSKLAQRGHSKQQRHDLRQVSLSLAVSRDGQIPLGSRVFAGNVIDVRSFPESLSVLRDRLRRLCGTLDDTTFVFDKGNCSKANQALIDADPTLHYVTSLPPSRFRDLMAIPRERYEPLSGRLSGVRVHRVRREVWGRERTLVLLISEKLRRAQLRGLYQHVAKRVKALEAWRSRLANPRGRRLSPERAALRIDALLRGQHLREVLRVDYDPQRPGIDALRWSHDAAAEQRLASEVFGKRVLMTDRDELSSEQIVEAHNGQSRVERTFRQLKDPAHLAARPQHHWTDQKVHVHLFCCVLALLLGRVLEHEARRAGRQETLSHLLDELRTVRLAMVLRPSGERGGRPRAEWQLEDASDRTLDLLRRLVPAAPPYVYTVAVPENPPPAWAGE